MICDNGLNYPLRSKLLVVQMDVSRTKIHLDTSIPAISNSERRKYNTISYLTIFHVRRYIMLGDILLPFSP